MKIQILEEMKAVENNISSYCNVEIFINGHSCEMVFTVLIYINKGFAFKDFIFGWVSCCTNTVKVM